MEATEAAIALRIYSGASIGCLPWILLIVGRRNHAAQMSVEITTEKNASPEMRPPRRLTKMRGVSVLLLLVLIGFALYLLVVPSSGTVQVNGQLSAGDVKAIRRGVTRWRHRDLSYSMTHLRFRMFWDQVRVLRTCPLVSIASYDGKTGFATYRGRSWTGNQVSIVYMFTNAGGVWSGTTATRSEKK